LLPCFWIYAEVGNYIVKKSSKGNPYQAWIDTYSGEEFNAAVEKAIEITEEAADNTTENNRLTMKDAFLTSSELEWNFWNDAYTLKRWEPKANNQF
jgi:thiaminase/transcriptional activator TenA